MNLQLSELNEVIEWFKRESKECWNIVPEIILGKDKKRVNELLKWYHVNQLKDIITWYLEESDKVKEYGCSLSVALSADTINQYFIKTGEKQMFKKQ